MPWFDGMVVVVANEVPAWLAVESERVVVVPHAALWNKLGEDRCVPAFAPSVVQTVVRLTGLVLAGARPCCVGVGLQGGGGMCRAETQSDRFVCRNLFLSCTAFPMWCPAFPTGSCTWGRATCSRCRRFHRRSWIAPACRPILTGMRLPGRPRWRNGSAPLPMWCRLSTPKCTLLASCCTVVYVCGVLRSWLTIMF